MEAMTCCNCGIVFHVPGHWLNSRRKDKRVFYCPNGHAQSFTESELDRVRRECDRLKQQMAQKDDEIAAQRSSREHAERSAAARKGQITRLKNRAAAGVCPCCNRTFENLRRHMSSKHPAFMAEEVQ